MKNFVLAIGVVFLVLCVPWFCVAQASSPEMREAMRRFNHNMEVGIYCSQMRMFEGLDGKCTCKWDENRRCSDAESRLSRICGERVEVECNFRNRVR